MLAEILCFHERFTDANLMSCAGEEVVLKRLELVKSERGMVSWGWLVVLIIVLVGAVVTLRMLPRTPATEPSAVVARGKIQPMPAPTQTVQNEVPQKTATEDVALLPIKSGEAPSPAVDVQSGQAPEPVESNDSIKTRMPVSNEIEPNTLENAPSSEKATSSSEDTADVDNETGQAMEAQGLASDNGQPEPVAEKNTPFAIQVGAFHNKGFAENMTSQLKERGYPAFIFEVMNKDRKPFYLVRFGQFSSRDVAARSAVAFREKEKMPVLVVVSTLAE